MGAPFSDASLNFDRKNLLIKSTNILRLFMKYGDATIFSDGGLMRSFSAREPNTVLGSTPTPTLADDAAATAGLPITFLPFLEGASSEGAFGLIIFTRIFFAIGFSLTSGFSLTTSSTSNSVGSSSETIKDGPSSSNSFSFSGESIFLSISLGTKLLKVN